jgi:hypothetical protein
MFLGHGTAKRLRPLFFLAMRLGVPGTLSSVSIFAVALALAFTGQAFAGEVTKAKTEADCQKAGGMWDAKTSVCSEKKM